MSLRRRLVVALVVLALAGLVVTEAVTYVMLRSFLHDRVEQQLDTVREPLATALEHVRPPDPPEGGAEPPPAVSNPVDVPRSAWGMLLHPDGRLAKGPVSNGVEGEPDLPAAVPEDATFDAGDFRVRTEVLEDDSILVTAVPTGDVDATLARLRNTELVVTLVVLIGLALLARWVVRLGLRPLERMERTADAIAGGDLRARVETDDPRTEVGRLGGALNVMLGRIEEAFAQRLAAEDRLRRFLADASHELRTPLTSIRGYAELFRRGADKRPEDLAKAMQRIESESARMGQMVEELLLLAHFDQGRPMERDLVDLAELASDAVDDARAAQPDRRLHLALAGEAYVFGDTGRLRQVLVNLVGNALRHTPPEATIAVHLRTEGDDAVLEVVDDGPGLPPGAEERVFEAFYRGDPARHRDTGGSGLGLAIVAAITAAHDGSVTASSAPGEGATFTVRLPLASEPAVPPRR